MVKKVLKFGGTSVGSIKRIQHVAKIVEKEQSKEAMTILKNMYKCFKQKDISLLEINPLIESADKKIIGCLYGISSISAEERIAGPVFFFAGSNTIL